MFIFLLAVITSALVSVIMRLSGRYIQNNLTMLASNYVMCTVLGFVCTQTGSLIPAWEGAGLTMVLGVINGILYLGGFVMLQWNMKKNGVVLPATFMKLGVLVPALMAVTVFGEQPTVTQIAGVLAAVAAIILIRFEKGQDRAQSASGLILLLLCGGMADGMSKVYEHYGSAALSDHFLLITFLVALLLCTGMCIAKKQSVTPMDVLFGLLIGIPNYFTARFLLMSLDTIPAIVAYPCYSVGTIVLVTLAGWALFREKLSRRQWAALSIILVSLVLLNL